VDRRTLLKAGGAAILGLGFGGCATTRARSAAPPRRSPARLRLNLPPIKASWDRVLRTTVGLRPHRPAGFVVRAEKLDAKTLIHDYGHGGTGLSLGWGTGAMAADLALQQPERRAAVLGCGAVGLTVARQLQRRGFGVTIYTKTVPPDTTSNMALAAFTPTAGLLSAPRTPEWDAQFRQAAEISYTQLQLLVGPRYGLTWIDSYNMTDTPPSAANANQTEEQTLIAGLLPAHLRTGQVVLEPGEHPFPTTYAVRRSTLRIEPSIYLDALARDVLQFGGHIVIRTFDAPRDLMSLSEPVIVNCTGLGSRDLFADQTMMPVKGQLSVIVPQPEVDYQLSGGGERTGNVRASAMPRSDGIVIGNSQERGVSTLEPNEETRKRNIDAAIAVFGAIWGFAPDRPITRSVAPSPVPAIEDFFGLEEC